MTVRFWFAALVSAPLSTAVSAQATAPQVFGSGTISSPVYVAAPAFTPDGATVYFHRKEGDQRTIYLSHKQGDNWSPPVEAPFARQWTNIEPAMAPDGSYMIFASNRPIDSGGKVLDGSWGGTVKPGKGGNLWRVDRVADGWSAARRLPANVNDATAVFAPAISQDGTLFFMKPGPDTKFHLYQARPNGASYGPVEQLPFFIQGKSDFDPAVARDGSYILFGSNRDASDSSSTYIAFRTSGGWTTPLRLPDGAGIGDDATEYRLSPDENTLYFSRDSAILSVPFAAVRDQLRTQIKQ